MCGEKQYVRCFCVFFVEDHPRVCGEKEKVKAILIKSGGSPPRMRGKVQSVSAHVANGGITPAYAGKRVRCSQQALPRTDHPRMCGEKHSCDSVGTSE